jgi:Heterokaryon incompatibility protein (HET)
MSERTSYDALSYHIPRQIRSKLLHFDAEVIARDRVDDESLPSKRLRVEEGAKNEGEAKIPEFKYDQLPPNKKRIRLLRLWPGVLENPQIDCEMFEAEFDEKDKLVKVLRATSNDSNGEGEGEGASPANQEKNIVKYEALSWRWGDEYHGKYAVMIHKDGALYRKRVSQTLGLALKYLRFEKDRFLWIDALCINQNDHDERSSQVAMMSLVYTAAEKACVWLGEDDDESTMAIKFIREEINQLKDFDSLCTDKQHAPKWRSLLVLMQRPWFSRRWVVQEIVLAQKATVYCGPDKIEWPELAIAVELFVEVETATHRLSELMKKDEKFTLIPNWFEHISELGASLLVNATARVYRESEHNSGILARTGVSRRSLLSLEYLVTSLSIFDCGRPHDSVYALVAIARDARPLAPSALLARNKEILVAEVCSNFLEEKSYILDYNSPYTEVCRDFIQFCIERCASIDKVQALDILCRPWAKDWLPGEHKGVLQDQKVEHSEKRLMPREKEKPWVIRIKAGRLREKLEKIAGATDADKLVTFLKAMGLKDPNGEIAISTDPEEVVEILDDRDHKQYWEYAKTQSGVRPIIEEWFPDSTKQEEKKKKPAKMEPPLDGIPKAATKKIRRPPGNAQTNTEANTEVIIEALGIPCPDEKELALPSWVVRITAAPFDIFAHPGMDMVKMGRENADPLVGIPQDGHRNYNAGQTKKIDLESLKFRKRPRCHHYSLYVKGFWLDTVAAVAQVSQGGAIPAEWLDLAGWPEARRPQRPGEPLKNPPPDFWRTLVADRGMFDRNPPYYYARACKETILKGGLRSGAVDTTALIYNERNSIVAEFCRRVQAVIWNRALIKTEKGNLGLASDKVRVGDMVCIIYGCTVPIILRKKNWKSRNEHKLEKFEDGVEAMKNLIRKCKKNRARKGHWEKSRKTTDAKKLEEVKYIQDETKKFNSRKVHKEYKYEPATESPYPSDYESEDLTDSETEKVKEGKKREKQNNAERRGPYRHYEFFGEAYIHKMMDGDAVRQNFYNLKPDHLFEIR